MPLRKNKKYIVLARKNLFKWVKERALTNMNFAAVAKFLYEKIITRHEIFDKLINDDKPKNKK